MCRFIFVANTILKKKKIVRKYKTIKSKLKVSNKVKKKTTSNYVIYFQKESIFNFL